MVSQEDRFAACWGHLTCDRCLNDANGCGWCPSSWACVPATNLLDPIRNEDICPLWNDRFELRTRTLGCGCSTTTLLSIVVTIFATIAALMVLSILLGGIRRLNRTFGSGTWQGVEIEVKDGGQRIERDWWRNSWLSRLRWSLSGGSLSNRSEQEQVTERSRLLG